MPSLLEGGPTKRRSSISTLGDGSGAPTATPGSPASPSKAVPELPLPLTLRFLSSNNALVVFLTTLVVILALAIGMMAMIQAVDPPTVLTSSGGGGEEGAAGAGSAVVQPPDIINTVVPPPITSEPTATPASASEPPNASTASSTDSTSSDSASLVDVAAAAASDVSDAASALVSDAVDSIINNNNPEINDSRITALQFLWVISPTASTIAIYFALRQYKKRHAPEAPLAVKEDNDAAAAADASASVASKKSLAPPAPAPHPPPLHLPPVAADAGGQAIGGEGQQEPADSPLEPGQPVPSRAFYTPLPIPGGPAAPTLGLENLPKFEPLAHALLRPTASPGPTDTNLPALPPLAAPAPSPNKQTTAATDAADTTAVPPSTSPSAPAAARPPAELNRTGSGSVLGSLTDAAGSVAAKVAEVADNEPETSGTLGNFLTVTSVAPAGADGKPAEVTAAAAATDGAASPRKDDLSSVLFVAEGADLLRRLPYLPFLGMCLPELLLETRSKSAALMEAAAKRQPWYERLGLRLLFSTHLPQPQVPLRKWIFRTRYTRLQKWPRVAAFLVGAVVLPTLLTSLYGVLQYVIASGSGAQGWYNDAALAQLRSQLHLSENHSPAGTIILGFVYEAIVGCWWDIIPVSSADWGNGLGFSGASWIILAFIEEFGWMGGLFPLLYYSARVRHASAAITRWWYKDNAASHNGASGSPSTMLSPSMRIDVAPTPPSAVARGLRPSAPSAASSNSHHDLSAPPSNQATPAFGPVSAVHSPVMSRAAAGAAAAIATSDSPVQSTATEWIHVTLVCLILGLIWSAWHWPFILLRDWLPHGVGYVPGTADTPLAYGFFMWVPRIIATRFVIVYFCISCGSFWGAVVYHAVHNVMVYSYWAILPDADGQRYPFARYMHAESGITIVVAYILTAAIIVHVWKRHDERGRALWHKGTESNTPTQTHAAPTPRAAVAAH